MSQQAAEVRTILATECPKAMGLLTEIEAYCGSELSFHFNPASDPSSAVAYQCSSLSDICTIEVHIHRSVASIVHELLHLKLNMLGFPIPNGFGVSFQEAVRLTDAVSHPLFLGEFLSFGLQKSEFFFEQERPEDMAAIRRYFIAFRNAPNCAQFVRGAWNRMYFAQWIANEMGFKNQRDDFLALGRSDFNPDMDCDAAWIESWYARGDSTKPGSFPVAITEFMHEFHLGTTGFIRLVRASDHLRQV